VRWPDPLNRSGATVLNPATSANTTHIDVRLQPETSAQKFEAVVARIPGIVSAATVTGDFDFRVRVACKDQSDLMRVIDTLRARAGVQGTNSAFICHEINVSDGLP
jgi:Lrp/AsnC family leucine-responsive transcriptional regulator